MPSELISADVGEAVRRLRAGGVVAIPTETVYGLAADVTNGRAVERVFDIKGRPRGHPLILHVASGAEIDRWSAQPSDEARLLARLAWPGPLTLIVPKSAEVPAIVTGGRSSVGLRCPAHPMATALLQQLAVGLVAPSANRFGAVSPTTAGHVFADLGDRLDPETDMILDGGACSVGVESTIVDCTTDPLQLLRAGAITAREIERLIGTSVAGASGPARASGMLESHYAPRCQVRLVDSLDDAVALRAGTQEAQILDLTGDLADSARRLYGELRAADDRHVRTLIVVLPPPEGLGHAIRDRLAKAAAPR